jgi:hypothetical protein
MSTSPWLPTATNPPAHPSKTRAPRLLRNKPPPPLTRPPARPLQGVIEVVGPGPVYLSAGRLSPYGHGPRLVSVFPNGWLSESAQRQVMRLAP